MCGRLRSWEKKVKRLGITNWYLQNGKFLSFLSFSSFSSYCLSSFLLASNRYFLKIFWLSQLFLMECWFSAVHSMPSRRAQIIFKVMRLVEVTKEMKEIEKRIDYYSIKYLKRQISINTRK